jgi:hypothetical protein
MSPIFIILAAALVAGFSFGGSVRPFERLRVHWWPLALVGLGLQVAPSPGGTVGAAMLIGSYVVLIAFALVNRRLAGAWLVVAGLALNLAVITPNGGMPVSAAAIARAGGHDVTVTRDEKHHLMTATDVMRPLGDVIPLPSPVDAILSIGDVALYAGLAWFVVAVMLGRSGANVRPPAKVLQMYRGKHLPVRRRLPARYRRMMPDPAAATMWGSGP